MPRREYVIRVFVSSPSDLGEERQQLEELVRELNATWSRQLGLRIELVRWETSVLPGVGADPQAVIDASIGDDYDAFVGLLWTRFGTPTSTYGSGTAQEFERALSRARVDPNLRLMVYFNETPVSPADLDPSQLEQVRAFRASLGARGVLWLTYRDRAEFLQLLRLHLSKLAQEWQMRLNTPVTGAAESSDIGMTEGSTDQPSVPTGDEGEDEGLLDLAESIQADVAALTATSERLTQAITDVQGHMEAGTAAIQSIRDSGDADAGRFKRAINRTAEDVDVFAKRIEAEIPVLSTVFERLVRAVARAAVLQAELPNADNPLPGAISSAESLVTNIKSAMQGTAGMRQAAAGWPRMSTAMNRARRRAVDALDRLNSEFQRAVDVTEAVIGSLKGRLE